MNKEEDDRVIKKILTSVSAFTFPAMIAVFAFPASGELVDFTTTGSFACAKLVADNPGETCHTNASGSQMTVTKGTTTVSVSVTAVGDSYVDLLAGPGPQADVDVMTIRDTYTLSKTAKTAPVVGLTGSTFTFDVDQTGCIGCAGTGTGTGSLTGNITGSVSSVPVTAAINYTSSTITIDHIRYILDDTTWTLAHTGKTSASNPYGQEIYTAQVLPEPRFLLLSGLGFAAVAFVAYRRRRATS